MTTPLPFQRSIQYYLASIHSKDMGLNCMDWTPPISELSGPRYQRIVDAMEADIAAGRLVRGQQLPTQRALANALGIALTTATRGYTEADRTSTRLNSS